MLVVNEIGRPGGTHMSDMEDVLVNFLTTMGLYTRLPFFGCFQLLDHLEGSSVASPFCQEGQSERTFPVFAFPSRCFPPKFLRYFPSCPPLFPDFWQIFRCQGDTLPHFDPRWLHHCRRARVYYHLFLA